MFLTEINTRIRELQFQNNTNIKRSQGSKSAENKIKTFNSNSLKKYEKLIKLYDKADIINEVK